VNAGELRNKITIQELQRVPDGYGGYTETWNNITAKTWAEIQPLRGSERYQAQRISNALSHKVILRYLDGIKPQMRVCSSDSILPCLLPFVLDDLQVFHIVAAINVEERNEMLELLCEEKIT